jgi:uncharacterized coiled-coil protein SlyX
LNCRYERRVSDLEEQLALEVETTTELRQVIVSLERTIAQWLQ